MKMIAYKVVTPVIKKGTIRFFSATMKDFLICSSEYYINKPTKPIAGCGPLCCFEDAEAAINFTNTYPWCAVFKCNIVPSAHKHIWLRYLFETKFGDTKVPLSRLPEKTILADEVTLTEDIHGYFNVI